MKNTCRETSELLGNLEAGIATRVLGHKLHVFMEVDSTNDVAVRLARDGAEQGEVVVADAQKKGKGRMGRSWESPAGCNIYMSVILKPNMPPKRLPLITLMTAVACAEAIGNVTRIVPTIKWPNDVLVGGKKLAGIRTETGVGADRGQFVIVGIGINVNVSRGSLPEPIRNLATSLREELGQEVSRVALIRECLGKMDVWYTRLAEGKEDELRRRWESLSQVKGRRVEVTCMGEVVRGRALGIDEDGALLIQACGNELRRVVAGDVTLSGW